MPGTTTLYGLTYPLTGDTLASGRSTAQQLAEDVESTLAAFGGIAAPTSWAGVSYAANWADLGFGWTVSRYRKVGASNCRVEIATTRSTSASGADATIGTLPGGFRPTAGIQFLPGVIVTGAALTTTVISVTTAGVVATSISVPSGSSVLAAGSISLD